MNKKDLAEIISKQYESFANASYTIDTVKISEVLKDIRVLFFGRYLNDDDIDPKQVLEKIEDDLGKEILKFSSDRTLISRFL
ncbi:MAG: hypothetical protein IIZ11_02035, partial [Erysipelotrichaceae bacterium]|nr:hypothetical protein [Erysipelotrichaceae bacterium]